MGSHLIDVVVRLLGLPEKVTSVLKHHGRFDYPLKDNTVAIFEYPKALAIIQSATLQPNSGPHRGFEFQGTNGTAVVRPVEPPALHIDLSRASGPYQPKMQKVDVPAYTRYVDDMAELPSVMALRTYHSAPVAANVTVYLNKDGGTVTGGWDDSANSVSSIAMNASGGVAEVPAWVQVRFNAWQSARMLDGSPMMQLAIDG